MHLKEMTNKLRYKFYKYLFNQGYDIFHDFSKIILFDACLGIRKTTNYIGHDIVQRISFPCQLGKEQFGHI